MGDAVRRLVRLIVSAIVAGLLASCGSLITALQSGGAITPNVKWTAIVLGITALCVSVQSSLSQPPTSLPPLRRRRPA